MKLSQLYVIWLNGCRPGTTRRVCPRRARLSQLYLAWGEGVTFAGLAPLLVRKCFRSINALSQ
eukprot:2489156-Prymnesium_polylepis.1